MCESGWVGVGRVFRVGSLPVAKHYAIRQLLGSTSRPTQSTQSARSTHSLSRPANRSSRERRLVGLSRFELLTPRLSSVCSNQLSYRPDSFKNKKKGKKKHFFFPHTLSNFFLFFVFF